MDARIQLLHEDPREAITRPWGRDPAIFDLFLADVLRVIDSRPRDGRDAVKTIIRHAPTSCQRVRGYGLWAQIHRAIGELDAADTAIAEGFFLGGDCQACLADLHRRRAVLQRNRHNFNSAMEAASEAVRRYIKLGHPGHDLHGNGLASSYNVRAIIRFYMKNYGGAADDERQALAVLKPKASPVLYRIVIANLANALQATGQRSDLLESASYLDQAQQLFKGVRDDSQERSKLNWVTAQVRYQLGKGRPYELRELMERALRFFLSEGMVPEATAIASDLMKMKLARKRWGRDEPRTFVRNILDILKSGMPRLPREELSKPFYVQLESGLRGVHRAVNAEDFEGRVKLKIAVDILREACGPDQIACLVTWPDGLPA